MGFVKTYQTYTFKEGDSRTICYKTDEKMSTKDYDSLFEDSNVKSVVIPEGVTMIPNYCFMYCYDLETVTIPSTVKHIGRQAFFDIGPVLIINAVTPPTLEDGESTFNDTNNCPIYVPSGSVNAYKTAEGWSTYASRIQPIPTT
jgi:hypothetical protein